MSAKQGRETLDIGLGQAIGECLLLLHLHFYASPCMYENVSRFIIPPGEMISGYIGAWIHANQ